MNQQNIFSEEEAAPKFSSYEQMCQIASACTKCPLSQERNKVVIQDGNEQAQLMFIGEGPGEQEDQTGTPFVGRAGQLLDKILQAAGIDRHRDTYICNVVKCRPPNNRAPLLEEMEACREYLEYQIQHVQPKIIVLLGASALKGVLKLKDPKITKLHGKWLETEVKLLEDMKVMPFYHPSYLLRNPSRKEGSPKWQAWQAIKLIKQELDSLIA